MFVVAPTHHVTMTAHGLDFQPTCAQLTPVSATQVSSTPITVTPCPLPLPMNSQSVQQRSVHDTEPPHTWLYKRFDTLRNEISHLYQRLTRQEEKTALGEDVIAEQKSKLKQRDQDLEDLKVEIDTALGKCSDVHTQKQQQQQLDSQGAHIKVLQKQLSELENQVAELRRQVSQSSTEN